MNFAYTILYVSNVTRAIEFYEKAFGLTRRFVGEDGNYGELETGATTLSFSNVDFMRSMLPGGFTPHDPARLPAAVEIGLTTPDVPAAFAQALACGATAVMEPKTKPWGQVVAYVRDGDGILVEICTPMS